MYTIFDLIKLKDLRPLTIVYQKRKHSSQKI